MTAPIDIVFPVYDRMTQLDFTGPHQFLHRLPGGRVTVASVGGRDVVSDDGLTFSGLRSLDDIDSCTVLCVPGGMPITDALQDERLVANIRRLGLKATWITSVCSGSLLLGAAGLLRGKRAACHWFWRDLLPVFGAIPDAGRVVHDGNVFTGGGVTAGIDFALSLIAEIAGNAEAQAIQLRLEYAPSPPFDSGTFATAPKGLGDAIWAQAVATEPARRALLESIAARMTTPPEAA